MSESSPGALICSSLDEIRSSQLRQFRRLRVETPTIESLLSAIWPCREVWLDIASLSGNRIGLGAYSVAEGSATCKSIASLRKPKMLINDVANAGSSPDSLSRR